jgi:hypothetical protein
MNLRIYLIFYSGKEKKEREIAVASVVDTSLKYIVLDFKLISDRICVYLSNSVFSMFLINVHSPTEDSDKFI